MCRIFCLLFFASLFSRSIGQDTIRMSIDTAEKNFLQKNLSLIAQKYQIEEAKAAIIQAKLFDNPTFYYEHSIVTPLNGQLLVPAPTSESYFQLQQLFYMAGKRKKRTNIEKINTQMTEFEYYDMVRTLKNELYTSFYDIHYMLQSLAVYNSQLVSAQKIADAMDDQYKKGNISLKEVTRIKALIFSLESGKLDVMSQIMDKENSLKVLTRIPAQKFILPLADDNKVDALSLKSVNLQQLISLADTARFDLKESELAVKKEEANLAFQRSLAVPDVTLGTTYDKTGSFIQNYEGVGIGIPLPAWNRNQGNIRAAKNSVEEKKAENEQLQSQIENDVVLAYQEAKEAESLYKNFDKSFTSDYEKLISGITMEYQKHNISLLEFLDYYQTYTQSMSDMLHLRSKRIEALENINLATGTTSIK